MERKIGETFEFEGKKIEVKEVSNGCDGCFLKEKCCIDLADLVGKCGADGREDNKGVVFVEVQEQQAEEPKERKVGEVFEYQGKKLKVVETEITKCDGCYFFDNHACLKNYKVAGECLSRKRTDYKPIIFVEVHEQPQELNLCEILKDCPKGTKLYSPIFGKMEFETLSYTRAEGILYLKYVVVKDRRGSYWYFNLDGRIAICGGTTYEIMLFPSETVRNWEGWSWKY